MKNSIISIIFFTLSIVVFAQTAACDGRLPFEEKDGLLTIEMESGIINHPNWKVDNSVPGYAGDGYIFWDGPESFSSLSNAPIEYNIKINTPGTYRFAWHMKINKGTSRGEHNDAWLKIEADDYYGIKNGNRVIPRPACQTEPNNDCPEGSSTMGFFKIFGNTLDWRFVANTNDGDSHRVFVTFNNPGIYKITLDARSSFCLLDRMVLRLNGISDSVAFNLSNSESTCFNPSLSIKSEDKQKDIIIFPNPTKGVLNIINSPLNTKFSISNIHGAIVSELTSTSRTKIIDISALSNGVYFITYRKNNTYFVEKIVKL